MEVLGQFAAVVAVLALAAATSWWLRRRGFAGSLLPRKAAGRRLESVGRLSLGPQQTLHLVRLGERALLVASSPSGCVLLQTVDWREVQGGGEALT
ncbi:MAG TPA: flagellar biosynthetic protein FliO [Bryobacteraceae bacterium]|jgi:flagellar biosynthetic protein FliO|nr:flagellar biosynthetic protein FliO [Bryobacteraceae bacterium]